MYLFCSLLSCKKDPDPSKAKRKRRELLLLQAKRQTKAKFKFAENPSLLVTRTQSNSVNGENFPRYRVVKPSI